MSLNVGLHSLRQQLGRRALPDPLAGAAPTCAVLDWSHLLEDVLDPLGVSFEVLREQFRGSWIFGYIEALRTVGVRTVWFGVSARVQAPYRFTHVPTGATICLLPAPAAYRAIRRHVFNPYALTLDRAIGDVHGGRRLLLAALKELAPYVATPVRWLAHELRREGCQLLLCQEYEHARFDTCVLVGRWLHLPVFATFQGGDTQLSRLEHLVRPFTLRACAGLIIATHSELQRVSTQYQVPSTKMAHIFNPIDLAVWHPTDRHAARAALGIPRTAQVVVWHGRVELHRKGLDILLEAWPHVCGERTGRDLRLLLVGTGPDAAHLRQLLATRQLTGVLWIEEFVHDPAVMQRYLAAADVYTLPSRHEGFPVAPLEAMACGLPVVLADAPGVPDILEDETASGGLMVPRENPAALARALGRLLDDAAWGHELGRRARQRIEAHFSFQAVGRQLRAFFAQRAAAAWTTDSSIGRH